VIASLHFQAKDESPRIAEGKYLKLLYDLHDTRGTLNVDKKELGRVSRAVVQLWLVHKDNPKTINKKITTPKI